MKFLSYLLPGIILVTNNLVLPKCIALQFVHVIGSKVIGNV